MEREMRGIYCCGDCIHYNLKKHRCTVCQNIETDPRAHFFDDCPLPKVAPLVHGNWSLRCDSHLDTHTGEYDEEFYLECSVCRRQVRGIEFDDSLNWTELVAKYPYCHCGAKMNP